MWVDEKDMKEEKRNKKIKIKNKKGQARPAEPHRGQYCVLV